MMVASTPNIDDSDRAFVREAAGDRLELIATSYARLAGEPLVPTAGDFESAMWHAKNPIGAHDNAAQPCFFYANRAMLTLFAMRADKFIGLPSHVSAEPDARQERKAMLARLERNQIIADYFGVRISAEGRRFIIEGARLWNLVDAEGVRQGQAATFPSWRFITR